MSDREINISKEEFETALYDYVRENYDDNPADILDIDGVKDLVAMHHVKEIAEYIVDNRERASRLTDSRLSETKIILQAMTNAFENARRIERKLWFKEVKKNDD